MSKWSDTEQLDDGRFGLNGNLRGARNKTMLKLLGNPRGSYSSECQAPTNEFIRNLIVVEDVGPFRVRGLRPAVETLRAILADVRQANEEIYDGLGHVGMLCCRFVRGSTSAISNHSWGTAIDLTIDGVLDKRGNNRAQKGLLEIYKHFNKHGFFWGAAFPTEDAMHFEASEDLIQQWHRDGKFGGQPDGSADDSLLEFGDRSASVLELQRKLEGALGLELEADGIFGAATRAAVIEFQKRNNLEPDGVVGKRTAALL